MLFLEIVDHRVVVYGIVGWVVDEFVRLLSYQVLLIEPVTFEAPVWRQITEWTFLNLHFVEQRLEDLFAVLEADFPVGLEILSYSVLRVLVHESNPVVLVAILHPLEFAPVVSHDFLVVVCDEGLEYLGLLGCARVDLCEQSVDEQFLDDNHWLLVPDLRTRHVQSMPQTYLDLVHEQLLRYCVHLEKKRQLGCFLAMVL